jgi:DNA-directed RNA polymerase subunit L
MSSSVELISFTAKRKELDIPETLPLLNTYVTMEIKGIPTEYINAIRRTSIDEIESYALQTPDVSSNSWDCNDKFILHSFVEQRIGLIRLKHNIDEYTSIRYNLNVENNTTSIMKVYSKDLKLVSGKVNGYLFNPTYEICILQPSTYIIINDIFITVGIGKNNAKYQKACNAFYTHLDIEQYSHDETHSKNGSQSSKSGYKESCMLASPKHHLYVATIPATSGEKNEITNIYINICNNITHRLRKILSCIDSPTKDSSNTFGIEYNVYQISDGNYEGVIIINNETATIGNLIKKTLHDLVPDLNVNFCNIEHHNGCIKLIIQHREHINKLIIKTIKHIILTFDTIQKSLSTYTI